MTCAVLLAEPRGTPVVWDWLPCVLVHLGLSAVLVTASALVLRRTSRRAGDGRAAATPAAAATPKRGFQPVGIEAPPEAPAEERPVAEPLPNRSSRPAAAARDVSDHPVLWRETHRPLMAKPWQSVVGATATVVLLLVTYLVLAGDRLLDEEWAQAGYSWVFNLVVWLLTAVLSATAIATEKESDTWTLLLTTPLSGQSIVWGKVMGLYKRLMWPGVLIVTHFLAFTLFGVIRWPAFFIAVWVIFSFNSVWAATGLYLSVRVRKVTLAVIVNLLLAVVLYLAAFFVLLIIAELFMAHELPEWVAWYLPYYYLGEGITTNWSDPFAEHATLPDNLKVTGYIFLLTVFVVGLMHLALAFCILQLTATTFDRLVGRAPQAGRRRVGSSGPTARGGGALPGNAV